MSEKVSLTEAIYRFINKDGRTMTLGEMEQFKRSCTKKEFRIYAEIAADEMGLDLRTD